MKAIHIIISVFSYLIIWGLFSWKPNWESRLILATVCLIIKDLTLYIIEFSPVAISRIDLPKLHWLYQDQKISIRYYVIFLNRVYFFPLILTLYLVYLLITQTQLWDLHLSVRYLMVHENFLLFLTILSGVLLVVKEEKDEQFISTKKSLPAAYGYYLLSVWLWLLSTYLIYQQVNDLWNIGSIIAIIAGVLVFLVGVLLMEEEEDVRWIS